MWVKLLAFVIGCVIGFLEYMVIVRFVSGMKKKSAVMILSGVLMFIMPMLVLLACAFLAKEGLVWCAVGMTVMLIITALIIFLIGNKKRSK